MASNSSGVKKYTDSKTLLLYEEPKVVTDQNEYTNKNQTLEQYENSLQKNNSNKKNRTYEKKTLPGIESNPTVEDTLNAMFPPREWEENGEKKIAKVSKEPGNKDNARDLFKALDEKIKERQAREKGICPVREELYSQCFDEIIRQVTIECPERGILLHKVRDELKMTIASYQTLYESSILFGIRKQIKAVEGKEVAL